MSIFTQYRFFLSGISFCLLLAFIAQSLGQILPWLGAPIIAITLGIVIGNSRFYRRQPSAGTLFCRNHLLQWSIVGLGFQLDIMQVWQVASQSLPITLSTLSAALISTLLLSVWLKLDKMTTLLVGAGTAICGASAIAAVAAITKPNEQQLSTSLASIFLLNIVAVMIFPAAGHLLHMSDGQFGLWAGTAINDTSSVLAAAYSFSDSAGDTAMMVKLTRASFILPLCLWLAFNNKSNWQTAHTWQQILPLFILFFILAAALHSLAILPASVEKHLLTFSQIGLLMALASVGLSSKLAGLKLAGIKPIALGIGVWLSVACTSLALQLITR